ncbi:MAG: alanine--tRNA ligase-related protein, partial [Bacteroidales bacterium]
MEEFQKRLSEQKNRSRAAATIETDDWVELISGMSKTEFVGYQSLSCESKIIKYRSVKTKGKKYYQLILDKTPFYAESGGQVGDSGILESINEKIIIYNTVKENNLIIHSTFELPDNLTTVFNAKVNVENRISIQNNHSATHLLHHALRKVLGPHVEQKGSLVSTERLRFDFSHFSKVSSEELEKVESMVNKLIRENITLQEFVDTPIEEARKMGAMALFGEKYGDEVRVIRFGDSIELCGGTHVQATGNIGFIKIVSESAIAAGVRRIEAVTGKYAEEYVFHFQHLFEDIKQFFNSPNIMQAIIKMTQDNEKTRKDLEEFEKERIQHYTNDIKNKMQPIEGINLICDKRNMNPEIMKQAAYNLRSQLHNVVIIFGSDWDDKPNLIVAISDDLINKGLNASTMVREAGKLIKGGGGGQPGLATAGGKDCNGLQEALDKIAELVIMHK